MSRLFSSTLSIALLLFTATASTAQEAEARRQEEQPRAEREQPVDRERNDENRQRLMDRAQERRETGAVAIMEKHLEEMRKSGANETHIAHMEAMLANLRREIADRSQPSDRERQRPVEREREVPERFAQPEIRERAMAGLEKQIKEMRRVGGNETRIAQAERMLESLRGASAESPQPPRPETPHGQPEAARRLEHMRAAVEHLRQAGLVDPANHVNEMADRLQREMHHEGRERAGDPIREIMNQLGEMRREVAELRERLDRQER